MNFILGKFLFFFLLLLLYTIWTFLTAFHVFFFLKVLKTGFEMNWYAQHSKRGKKANRIKWFPFFLVLLFILKCETLWCKPFRAFGFRFIKLIEGRIQIGVHVNPGRFWYAWHEFQLCCYFWYVPAAFYVFTRACPNVMLFRAKM